MHAGGVANTEFNKAVKNLAQDDIIVIMIADDATNGISGSLDTLVNLKNLKMKYF